MFCYYSIQIFFIFNNKYFHNSLLTLKFYFILLKIYINVKCFIINYIGYK